MVHFVRKNDRREIRRALRFSCRVARRSDLRVVAEEAIDVSPDGMLIPTRHDLAVDDELLVSFCATQLGIRFDTGARVARLVRGRRDSDRDPGVGLQFTSLDKVKRLILRGTLRRVPPPVPKRAQRVDWSATVRGISPTSALAPLAAFAHGVSR